MLNLNTKCKVFLFQDIKSVDELCTAFRIFLVCDVFQSLICLALPLVFFLERPVTGLSNVDKTRNMHIYNTPRYMMRFCFITVL